MLKIITGGIAKLFGSKSDRDIKEVLPIVEKVKAEYAKLQSISDDELRNQTAIIKGIISQKLSVIDNRLLELKNKLDDSKLDVAAKEAIFSETDKLEIDRNKQLEVVLMEVLPLAFATVKETAKRWKENHKLTVKTTDHDKYIAGRRTGVEIIGDTAIWHNKWKATSTEVTWDMVHYDVQILGGVVLHQGKISEMATGEGKTLVATLPAFLNALASRGVHIVTVNDYLAKRDSEWMGPLFEFHGLKVDCIDKHEPNTQERKNAYLADITYGTNNEFGFDYLRDNMAKSVEELVQRKHHYAMVDEVDSVLIDDARTPLIIAGPVPKGDEHEFYDLKPRVLKLVDAQKKLTADYLNAAKKGLTEKSDDKEAALSLFRSYRGLPKSKPLIKYLSEGGVKVTLQKTENFYLQDNSKEMPKADEPLYFTIDEKHNSIELTDKGIDLITNEGEDPHFFILPDLSTSLAKVEKDMSLNTEQKFEKKEQVIADYTIKTQRIHTVQQLLKAYTLFEKDVEYIVVDNKVKIVDEQTGRVMEGRRYSDGLHQAIEAKENVKIEDATQTYATVTLQNYFRMYHKLAGMTGTAETEAGEFWEIYKLDVVVIPTNTKASRKDEQDKVFRTTREKFNAVAEEIVELTGKGRPVLVGTTSVEISELLSRMLKMRNIKHNVLNAKQHQKEADIVAEAGKPGTVTIATNMAGRGTDIKLTPESRAAGGLAIIGTERHESRRVDRQLRGRSGRQGDPGTSQFFVSLEDNLMRLFGSERIASLMVRMGIEDGEVIQHSMVTNSIERAQKKVEENNFGMRKRLLEYDDVMNSQREVVYRRRRNALYGDRLQIDVLNMIYDSCENIIASYHAGGKGEYEAMLLNTITILGVEPPFSEEEFVKFKADQLTEKLYSAALEHYNHKNKNLIDHTFPLFKDLYNHRRDVIENVVIPVGDGIKQMNIVTPLIKTHDTDGKELITNIEKYSSLAFIDDAWKEHLRDMDDLKQSVQNAVYEQKDPLLIYKMESFNLFKGFIGKLNEETVQFLTRSKVMSDEAPVPQQAVRIPERPQRQNYSETKEEIRSVLSSLERPETLEAERPKLVPLTSQKIANRNDKVSVQYMDGTVKKDVKFKQVEEDIQNNRCILLES
ncbi:MAG: preprotein translocase subunit SecA [Opitutaceae bacterium]|nr:preprotein translocase subunit SecA [Cytophagales bacterium]